jgi:hypothetical protein
MNKAQELTQIATERNKELVKLAETHYQYLEIITKLEINAMARGQVWCEIDYLPENVVQKALVANGFELSVDDSYTGFYLPSDSIKKPTRTVTIFAK